MAQTCTSYTFIDTGPSHLDTEFQVAQNPPGPMYSSTHSITRTDGTSFEASRQQVPYGSQPPAKIAISFAWSCMEEEARTQLQTKEYFQI